MPVTKAWNGTQWIPVAANSYGAFYSTVTQTASATNTPYAMTVNNQSSATDDISVVNLSSNGSRLTFAHGGSYNIQFSAQFYQSSNVSSNVDIWLRNKGVDVPWSNTQININKTGTEYCVAAWNWMVDLADNDYIQLMWATTDTATQIFAQAANTYPGIPSVILTAQQIR